jgi:hypothetical protein
MSSTPGRSVPPSLDGRFMAAPLPDRAMVRAYEAVLAEGLRGFLNELAMVNGAVMVSYICNNQHATWRISSPPPWSAASSRVA